MFAVMDIRKPIQKALLILLFIIAFGSIGYKLIEGWSLFDSLYMTVITITTTGYREVGELSNAGKVFSMLLMFLGIGVFFYMLNLVIPIIIEKEREGWKGLLERMENHSIICGFGRTGSEIAKKLPKEKLVIVDNDVNKVTLARELGFLAIQGDSTEEETLEMAGVKRAKNLIACTDRDSSNAFTIIVAKDLNPNIYTIAILRSPSGKNKLKRSGANVILSPYEDMAQKVLLATKNPSFVDLIEITSKKESLFLKKIETLPPNFIGKTLEEIDLRRKTGCSVVAIGRKDKIVLPDPQMPLQEGDILYIIGSEESLCEAESTIASL